jgi:hypothetical protein
MEEQMKGQVCEGKTCEMGGCCSGRGCWHRAIRLILGIAIIVIVFCFGVMVGELKGALIRETSGYRMMGNYGGGYGRAYPMTQNGYGGATAVPPQIVPSAPAK